MRILMMTNTYLPHVGGVARSVSAFTQAFRARGHEVLVVAPEFEGTRRDEDYVIRVTAIQNFNGSDFSVIVPSDGFLQEQIDEFKPDVIHSHHPFLLGGAAQRLAAINNIPLVFTHHTLYERYTHYVPGDSDFMKRFVAALSTEYANLTTAVIAPSESIRDLLLTRGVTTPVEVIPTGIEETFFKAGSGSAFRRVLGVAQAAFVVGHVGRLAKEKNLGFMTRAIAEFLAKNQDAVFLLVGTGPAQDEIEGICHDKGVQDRLIHVGTLQQPILTSAYRAMDVFAFASHSETQGMVLTEAMATRTPVVALDASGVREVLVNGENGIMLEQEDLQAFTAALQQFHDLDKEAAGRYRKAAYRTAKRFSLENSVDKTLALYASLMQTNPDPTAESPDAWEALARKISAEWSIFANLASAAGRALEGDDEDGRDKSISKGDKGKAA